MKMSTLFNILFCLLFSSTVFAKDLVILESYLSNRPLGEWSGMVLEGGRPCEAKLMKNENGKIDLIVEMTAYSHGSYVINKYSFKKSTLVKSAPAAGLVRSAYTGMDAQVKLLAAIFQGPEANKFRDLMMVTVDVPHGNHSHTYSCRF